MIIGKEIQNYKDEIIENLQELIKIRSVMGSASEGKPFGGDVNRALEYVLKLGEELGFKTKNVDGYAGHIEYGEGDELVGVLVHLDVVPEGTGWNYPPFGGEIHEGKIYGRGASDDKGPAIAALYSLKVLKDTGILPKKKIRVIFGANEENGMSDMKYYFSQEPVPDIGFSPDANYPIINREKGILHLILEKNTSRDDNYLIQKLWGGEAVNMVPPECRAFIPEKNLCSDELNTLKESAYRYNALLKHDVIAISLIMGEGVEILAKGKSAHGASPQEGTNAIYHMVNFLNKLGKDKYLNGFLDFIYEKIGEETTGSSLEIALKDEESGYLTLNLGKIEIDSTSMKAFLDIRYPVTCKMEDILPIIEREAKEVGISVRVASHSLPLYVPKTHPLIISLISAYEKITGKKAELLSMGGGTYARTLKNNGVAFGGAGSGAHQPNEYVSIDELMKHAEICTQAIYELACK